MICLDIISDGNGRGYCRNQDRLLTPRQTQVSVNSTGGGRLELFGRGTPSRRVLLPPLTSL